MTQSPDGSLDLSVLQTFTIDRNPTHADGFLIDGTFYLAVCKVNMSYISVSLCVFLYVPVFCMCFVCVLYVFLEKSKRKGKTLFLVPQTVIQFGLKSERTVQKNKHMQT